MSENIDSKDHYQEEDAIPIINELFSGKLGTADAIQHLRTRLLDLSSRNRLLNYKHPKLRSLQFVDVNNWNQVFDRLLDNKAIRIEYVPEPEPLLYTGRKPDAREHAEQRGIVISFELSSPASGRRIDSLQTLFYPAELERRLKKMFYESKTAIEETGTNILYLIFGFLEFYESDNSEVALNAPLLCVPVSLNKAGVDQETRLTRYNLIYNGDDVSENETLREKLKQDFGFEIPDFDENDNPEKYLDKIKSAIKRRPRWKAKRQLSLSFLSFGKLSIWSDLDPKKYPELMKHQILKLIFEGGESGDEGAFSCDDYDIDMQKGTDTQLIFDADSSQHSAIIDVMRGKNMVIHGPPGTGKSQTITNIIAAAISNRKKVLFVSEKLAALEVVRRRLDQAHLGEFCLQLHSHKTKKKKIIEEIEDRLNQAYFPDRQLDSKYSSLVKHKEELRRYAEIIGMHTGNGLDLSIHDIFWVAERKRQELAEYADLVRNIKLPDANRFTHEDLAQKLSLLGSLASYYGSIGTYGSKHSWWGFYPRLLIPSDEQSIRQIIEESLGILAKVEELVFNYTILVDGEEIPSFQYLKRLSMLLAGVSTPPDNFVEEAISGFFTESDPRGLKTRKILDMLSRQLKIIETYEQECREILIQNSDVGSELLTQIEEFYAGLEKSELLEIPLSELHLLCEKLNNDINALNQTLCRVDSKYSFINAETLKEAQELLNSTAAAVRTDLRLKQVREICESISAEYQELKAALIKIDAIAEKYEIDFDGSLSSIIKLKSDQTFPELISNSIVRENTVAEAKELSEFPLYRLPITELKDRREILARNVRSGKEAFETLKRTARQVGLEMDASVECLRQLRILAKIGSNAPMDLLPYRNLTFGNPAMGTLIQNAERMQEEIQSTGGKLSQYFYVDVVPSREEIADAVTVFRRGDHIFNFLRRDWRKARRIFDDIVRNRVRLKSEEYAEKLSELIKWIDCSAQYVSNSEFKECFGQLYQGKETDYRKIETLYRWYQESQTDLIKQGVATEDFDLTNVGVNKLRILAIRAEEIINAVNIIESGILEISSVFDLGLEQSMSNPFTFSIEAELQKRGLSYYYEKIDEIIKECEHIIRLFETLAIPSISPFRATQLIECKLELLNSMTDLELLSCGIERISKLASPAVGKSYLDSIKNLRDYICNIDKLCNQLMSLHDFMSRYVSVSDCLSDAIHFLQAKVELDETLNKFIIVTNERSHQSWDDYINMAKKISVSASGITAGLSDCVPINVTLAEAKRAIGCKVQADKLLFDLCENMDVLNLIGESFRGKNTDVEALYKTYEWGKAVVKTIGRDAKPTLCKLICPQAVENLRRMKSLTAEVVNGFKEFENRLESLGDFGIFDWKEWHESIQDDAGYDYCDKIMNRLEMAHKMIDGVIPWAKYLDAREDCRKAGLEKIVLLLENDKITADRLSIAFEYITYTSILSSLYVDFTELARFSGRNHSLIRSEYAKLDKEIIEINGSTLAHKIDANKKLPPGQTGMHVGDLTEMQLVRREIGKIRRHIPIRQLIKRAGHTLQELKPCFMMGPLSVAQYLEQGSVNFDIVIMDEASQLRPEEALGAIARGSQVVVVGDPKQLPPTNFFERMLESADEEDEEKLIAISGMESILDICQHLFYPNRFLRWHYRSQHESLISFSNHNFYRNNLIVFPSPYDGNDGLGVRYNYIKNGSYENRRNMLEAQRVVDAVAMQMLKYPADSIGVVSLNLTQRDLIEDLLDNKLKVFKEGQEFVAKWEDKGWPFFVKNLENVQGDERDVIIISTTFGKPPGSSKVRQNFGPISRPEGWRRLNVLFTRARKKIELFTSMLPEDILVDEKTPEGTKALHDYLEYARKGILGDNRPARQRDPDSDFEVSVAEVIKHHGYEVQPQLGVAGFFIDIAVRNPDCPGEYIAGIECDGKTYHSKISVRERDRIRQEILESLGWRRRLWRIWSADWFSNPRREIEKLLNFLEKRRAETLTSGNTNKSVLFRIDETKSLYDEISVEAGSQSYEEMDFFVEVGDYVTFCYLDRQDDKKNISIVEGKGNPEKDLIEERAPLAQALLGLRVGEEGTIEIPRQSKRMCRVLNIKRGVS